MTKGNIFQRFDLSQQLLGQKGLPRLKERPSLAQSQHNGASMLKEKRKSQISKSWVRWKNGSQSSLVFFGHRVVWRWCLSTVQWQLVTELVILDSALKINCYMILNFSKSLPKLVEDIKTLWTIASKIKSHQYLNKMLLNKLSPFKWKD